MRIPASVRDSEQHQAILARGFDPIRSERVPNGRSFAIRVLYEEQVNPAARMGWSALFACCALHLFCCNLSMYKTLSQKACGTRSLYHQYVSNAVSRDGRAADAAALGYDPFDEESVREYLQKEGIKTFVHSGRDYYSIVPHPGGHSSYIYVPEGDIDRATVHIITNRTLPVDKMTLFQNAEARCQGNDTPSEIRAYRQLGVYNRNRLLTARATRNRSSNSERTPLLSGADGESSASTTQPPVDPRPEAMNRPWYEAIQA